MFKRFATFILALIMVIGVFPLSAFAEENTLADRAYLQLGAYESAFDRGVSGFGNSEISGTHIKYTFSATNEDGTDFTEEEVIEILKGNTDSNPPAVAGGFVVKLDAPGEGYNVTAITIDGKEENVEDFVTESGELDGLGWLKYLDNGKLCNASKTCSVTWSNGSETITDHVMVSLVFPQVEENPGGGNNPPEGEPSNNSGEKDYPDAVTVEIPSSLDGVTYTYDPETGVVNFIVSENDVNDWRTEYVDASMASSGIFATIIVQAPDWAAGFTGANGNNLDMDDFKERVESEGHEFDPVRTNNPYYRRFVELAHITRNETTEKVTLSLTEEGGVTMLAWIDESGNITYQSISFTIAITEGINRIIEFDDDLADIRTISAEDFISRIKIDNITSNQMTEKDSEGNLNYKDGVLTITYTGEGTDYESVNQSFIDELGDDGFGEVNITVNPPAAGYKPYKMEFSSGTHRPGDAQTLPLWARFYETGRIVNDDEYYLYWISEDGSNLIIEKVGISFKFPFKNIWMEKYWEALSYGEEDSRLKITVGATYEDAKEYSLEELKAKGANITVKDGYIMVSFDENSDLDVILNIIAQVDPPEGAAYYKKNSSSAPNILDYQFADDQNEIVKHSDISTIENDGKPGMDLSGFEEFDVNGLKVYINKISGSTRVQVIDWYNEADEIIQRDYFYSRSEGFSVTEVAEAVENLSDPVEKPTPVGEGNWKLTTNHYPQKKENENVSAYYFQLEGDENTPEGDKVIYLPYSFIDETLTYEKAVEMKLKPKIHHYNDDHTELVEGKPIDGELTPYGIRFVVGSFSPFVLEWEMDEEKHEFGETTYEWSEDGKSCTAKRVCKICDDHVETAKAKVTGKQVSAPDCERKGKTEYTAVFDVDWAETVSKTIRDIPKTGHDWGKTIYDWSEDGKTCTAKRVCKNDEKHVETETVSAVGKKVKDPSCTEDGKTEYTADFKAKWAGTQTTIIADIPAIGHDWDNGRVVKEPTCSDEGVKIYTCRNNHNHTKEEKIPVDPDAHSFGNWVTVVEPGEDTKGEKIKECSDCGKIVSKTIPEKGDTIIISGETEKESEKEPEKTDETEKNPNTGAITAGIAGGIALIGMVAVFLLGKKH